MAAVPGRDRDFLIELTEQLAEAALRHAKPKIAVHSKTLAETVTKVRISRTEVAVHLTHYWAIYVHDGRRAFTTPGMMIWFRNPKDDPRLRASGGQTPARRTQLRSMYEFETEFKYWKAKNREVDPDGTRPQLRPMVVTRSSGAVQPKRFFENDGGMRGFPEKAAAIVRRMFSEHVMESTAVATGNKGKGTVIRDEAVGRL